MKQFFLTLFVSACFRPVSALFSVKDFPYCKVDEASKQGRNVSVFKCGWTEWLEDAFPVEKKQTIFVG